MFVWFQPNEANQIRNILGFDGMDTICASTHESSEVSHRDCPEPLGVAEPLIGARDGWRVLPKAREKAPTLDVLPDEVAEVPVDVIQGLQPNSEAVA